MVAETEKKDNHTGELEEIEAAVKELEDVENLDDVDLGLSDSYILQLVASQRFQLARNYQANALALQHLRASIAANKSVGNEKAVKEFEGRIEKLEPEVKHILRSIKNIDREYPGAKKEMAEQVAKVVG